MKESEKLVRVAVAMLVRRSQLACQDLGRRNAGVWEQTVQPVVTSVVMMITGFA